jgi:pyrimidine and pyridine-specific 5'-nucleotidase
LLADDNSLVLSRQPKTTASNGTGTTDDGWLSGIGVGGGSGDAFWEADDMSLEMVTDVNDGDVDEEVSSFSPPF